jgi:hypothetical protein
VTVSRNPVSKKLVGLHVDDWDKLEIADKDQALNRVAVNVGSGRRSLLFMLVRASRMEKLAAAAGAQPCRAMANGRWLTQTRDSVRSRSWILLCCSDGQHSSRRFDRRFGWQLQSRHQRVN